MNVLWYFKCYQYFAMNGKGNLILNSRQLYYVFGIMQWKFTSCEWNKIIVQYSKLFAIIIIKCFDD